MNYQILNLNPMKLTFRGSKTTEYRQFHMPQLSVDGALKKPQEKKKTTLPVSGHRWAAVLLGKKWSPDPSNPWGW